MIPTNKKIERMIQIARLYYEEDMTQHLIAQKMGISRPLVSQLLTEAKACGIVTIHISEIENREALLHRQLLERFHLSEAVVVPDGSSPEETDRAVASAVCQMFFQPGMTDRSVGLGCGATLGLAADLAASTPPRPTHQGQMFPLIGGIAGSGRGCHTNEMVRVLSSKSGFRGADLFAPALFANSNELSAALETSPVRSITDCWDRIDYAVVELADFPSRGNGPCPAEAAHCKAVGQLLAHCYNRQGDSVYPSTRAVLQASLGQLRDAAQVTAVCSSHLSPESVLGGLSLDVIDSLVLPISLARRLLELSGN